MEIKKRILYLFRIVPIFLISVLIFGCATTASFDERDPLEGFNRGVYSFNQTMDEIVFNPISKLYKAITPDIIEKGVSNFFSNLGDLSVIANEILQLKFDKAASDASRVLINSTIAD